MFITAIIATAESRSAQSIHCPCAGAVAMRERRQDRDRRVHAGHEVGDRDARLLRAAAGQVVALAGDAHEAAHALDDEVVAGAIGVRTVLPEAGDRRSRRGADSARATLA